MMKPSSERLLDGVRVCFARGCWFNASQVASRYGRDAKAWRKQPGIQEYIKRMMRAKGCQRADALIQVSKAQHSPGVWLHSDLMSLFCHWLPADPSDWLAEALQEDACLDSQRIRAERLDPDYLRECFVYNKETGELAWSPDRPPSHFAHSLRYVQWLEDFGGKPAGSTYGSGRSSYIRVDVAGVDIFAHTIVLAIHGISIPKGMVVDHLDGNGLNNRLDNLRVVTYQENARNCRMSERNTSGYNGVTWDKARKKWVAQGPRVYLGAYDTPEEAYTVRRAWEKEQGNFTERHGLEA